MKAALGTGAALAILLAAGSAAAQPEIMVFAGASHSSGGDNLVPPSGVDPACRGCLRSGEFPGEMTETPDDPRLATFGLGLVGSEGRARGGGEIATVIGFGDRTAGFTSVVTYAGVDQGRVYTVAGLGFGTYWGAGRFGTFDALAGDVRAELGVRLTRKWIVLGRGDLIMNSDAVSPVASLGLQWIPKARRR